MRVPLEWLSEHVDLTVVDDPHQLAADLAGIGLEEEDFFGPEVSGPLVVGRVLALEPEEHSNGKTINWCQVDVGEDEPRGIVCGAHNFAAGDLVVAALPGAVLPGEFRIAARTTYGHVSDGMICSLRELGLGEDHDGIIVLTALGLTGEPGDDAAALLGLDRTTLDVNVTPDRGYQLSIRGIAREYAMLKGQAFRDPADRPVAEPTADGFPVDLADDAPIHGVPGCSRFTALIVRDIDPGARTPFWMQRRLLEAGMRPISLAVDVTNYVMLELGQPLHAYDLDLLGERIVVRRARAGETLTTLDDVARTLDPEDLLITDESDGDSRIIGLAGVMGGAALEVSATTRNILLEAAHFDEVSIARTARRHRLPSEASRRFERGVDPALGPVAAQRAAELLVELGGGTLDPATTVAGEAPAARTIALPLDLAARKVGVDYSPAEVTGLLEAIGAHVEVSGDTAQVTVPTWRSDLTDPIDLVEEIARAGGYDRIPSVLPQAPGGRGLTAAQRARRRLSNLLAGLGYTEVLTYPFTSEGRRPAAHAHPPARHARRRRRTQHRSRLQGRRGVRGRHGDPARARARTRAAVRARLPPERRRARGDPRLRPAPALPLRRRHRRPRGAARHLGCRTGRRGRRRHRHSAPDGRGVRSRRRGARSPPGAVPPGAVRGVRARRRHRARPRRGAPSQGAREPRPAEAQRGLRDRPRRAARPGGLP